MADERETYVLEAKVELDPGAQAAINTLNQNTKAVKASMNELRLAVVALGSNSGDAARAKENINQLAKQMQNLGTTSEQTKAKIGGNNQVITNLSYQFQDLTTQITGGTDAMRALSQQLPQMAMGMGPIALVGATIIGIGAALVPVISKMLDLGKATKNFQDALTDAKGAFNGFDTIVSDFGKELDGLDFKKVVDGLNDMSLAARNTVADMNELTLTKLASEMRDSTKQVSDDFKDMAKDSSGFVKQLFDVRPSDTVSREIATLQVQIAEMGVTADNAGLMLDRFGPYLVQGNKKARDLYDTLQGIVKAQTQFNILTQTQADLLKANANNTAVPGGSVDKKAEADAKRAADSAAKQLEQLRKQFDDMFKGIRTPDEVFADSNEELDKLIAKLGNLPQGQVDRLRESFEKVRDAANEALAAKNMTQFEKGYAAANDTINKTADAVDNLNGKLFRLEELRGVEGQTEQFNALLDSLGKAAPAMDQVQRAAEKLAESKQTTAELTASVNAFGEAAGYSSTQLQELKQSMGLLKGSKDDIDAISVAIGNTLSNSISGFVDVLTDSEKSFKDWAASLIQQIGKVIIQLVLMQQLKAGLTAVGWGSLVGAANGAVFNQGTTLKQGVYHEPTLFAFAKGAAFGRMGVMAEAGSEAVVPLKRTASGDLGVQASPVNIQINNYTDSTVTTTDNTDNTGTRQIQILIEKQVKASMSNGTLDESFRTNYNLSRAGRG